MKEIWKPVKGYEDIYEISNLGKIRSLDHVTIANMKPLSITSQIHLGRELSPTLTKNGSKRITLRQGKQKTTYPVAKLVAINFLDGYDPNLHKLEYKDSDRSNCSAENLRYVYK